MRDLMALVFTGLVSFSVLVTTACGADDKEEREPTTSVARMAISTLVPNPSSSSFTVVFAWHHQDQGRGTDGLFVWRQGGGTRRFDFLDGEPGEAERGYFWSAAEFGPDVIFGAKNQSCQWNIRNSGEPCIMCSDQFGREPGYEGVMAALGSEATEVIRGDTVNGMAADCYMFDNTTINRGEVCVDTRTSIPVKISTVSFTNHELTQEMTAIDSSLLDAVLQVPVTGGQLQALQLPAAFLQ